MHAYTICRIGNWLRGRKIVKSPKSINTINTMNRTPPIPVKSYLVWKEKMVKEKTMTAVIPTARRTESALSYKTTNI